MRVAIHQPNFLPNPAFFAKMLAADRFVILDTAQLPDRGWVHRNKLLLEGQAQWVTVPVRSAQGGAQSIRDVRISYDRPWHEQLLRRAAQAYRKAPFKDELFAALERHLLARHEMLLTLNLALIAWLRELLDITVPFDLASDLDSAGRSEGANVSATRRNLDLARCVGGAVYLSGPSGKKYLDEVEFGREGMGLEYFTFKAPTYRQASDQFVEGVSILDMLLWIGAKETRRLLSSES